MPAAQRATRRGRDGAWPVVVDGVEDPGEEVAGRWELRRSGRTDRILEEVVDVAHRFVLQGLGDGPQSAL